MNIVESLYLCYRGLARTRSTFKHPKYQQPDHVLVSKLTNEEVNGALLNVLVRVKSKTFFCVQLRIDDCDNHRRYYVGINRRYENICVAYIHVTPMHQPLAAYLWAEGLKIKDLTLEAIRQEILQADEINFRALAPHHRALGRYDDPTAADDGNQTPVTYHGSLVDVRTTTLNLSTESSRKPANGLFHEKSPHLAEGVRKKYARGE